MLNRHHIGSEFHAAAGGWLLTEGEEIMLRVLVSKPSAALTVVVLLSVLYGCNRAPSYALTCDTYSKGAISYVCRLNDSAQFVGISLGMKPEQAFRGLCTSTKDSVWSLMLGDKNARMYTPLKKGLRCEDWPTFSKSSFWMLRSSGEPCVGARFMVVNIQRGQISRMAIYCSALVDAAKPTYFDQLSKWLGW